MSRKLLWAKIGGSVGLFSIPMAFQNPITGVFLFILGLLHVAYALLIWFGQLPSDSSEETNGDKKELAGEVTQSSREPPELNVAPTGSLLGAEQPDQLKSLGFSETQTQHMTVWIRTNPESDVILQEWDVLIAKDRQIVSDSSMYDVHSECAWKPDNWNTLEFENKSACDLSKLLELPKYQVKLGAAKHLIFIGMESFPDSKKALPDDSATLALRRSRSLFKKTYRASGDDYGIRQFWTLDLGKARTNDPRLEFDQRRAVIIAVRERRSDISILNIVQAIAQSARINNVPLADYTNAETAHPRRVVEPNSHHWRNPPD